MKKPNKLIYISIIFIVTFFLMLSSGLKVDYSFFIAIGVTIFLAIIFSPSFQKWDKTRIDRKLRENEIKREAYLKEEGRIEAREDYKDYEHRVGLGRKYPMGGMVVDLEKELDRRSRRK